MGVKGVVTFRCPVGRVDPLEVRCRRCERHGRLRLVRLIADHGAGTALPEGRGARPGRAVLRLLPAAARAAALVQAQRRPCARRPRSHLAGMHPPILVREPSAEERARLEAALRAPDAFTVRRAQVVLASAEGRRPRAIARELRCATQTVRNGIRAFNAGGVAALEAGSSRPRSAAPVLGEAERERLRAILHQPPRAFGHARSTWTLDLLAREAHGQGLSPAVLSGETIRQALLRLGAGWKRAKRWLTSPDPAYAQKN